MTYNPLRLGASSDNLSRRAMETFALEEEYKAERFSKAELRRLL